MLFLFAIKERTKTFISLNSCSLHIARADGSVTIAVTALSGTSAYREG